MFADRFGMTRQGVIQRIKRGTIKGERQGWKWQISEDEAKKYKKVVFGSRVYLVKL